MRVRVVLPHKIQWSAKKLEFGILTYESVSQIKELRACSSAFLAFYRLVEKIAQAGPQPFHRIAVHTGTVRVMTRILAGAMVDCPMVIVGLGEMVDVVFVGEELRPAFHLG